MISTELDITTAYRHRQRLYFHYGSQLGAYGAGDFFSLWQLPISRVAGFPGPGSAPTPPGEIPTGATVGALPLTLVPRDSHQLYLARAKCIYTHGTGVGAGVGTPVRRVPIQILDRLYHCQVGMLANGTVAVNGPTVTRGAVNGVGNGIAIETVSGLTGTGLISVTYANQDGVQKQTATLNVNTGGGQARWFPLTLFAGDSGVQSIVSVQFTNVTSYAGKNQQVVIFGELPACLFSCWPPQTTASDPQDALDLGLAAIDTGSSLFLVTQSLAASPDVPAIISGFLDVVEA